MFKTILKILLKGFLANQILFQIAFNGVFHIRPLSVLNRIHIYLQKISLLRTVLVTTSESLEEMFDDKDMTVLDPTQVFSKQNILGNKISFL